MSRTGEQLPSYPWIQYHNLTIWPCSVFCNDADKHFKLLKELDTRDNDVLLCTAPKSGTHWVHEIVSMLLTQTTEYNSKGDILDMYLEFQETEQIEAVKGQRLMHSHLPISFLPVQHIAKYRKIVYVNRNPKDRHVSMFAFMRGKVGVPENWTWSSYFDKHVLNDTFMTGWFNYTKEMTAAVHDQSVNIIQVLYEDLLMNPTVQIVRLAQFLDVPYTDDFIKAIANKCQFNSLQGNKIDGSISFATDGKSTIFRKGVIGDWKNWFTVAQNDQFNDMYQKEMADVDVNFTFDNPELLKKSK